MRKGWEYKKLGEVLETTSGGTPSKSHKEYYEGGTIPWLRSGEVSKGDIYDAELYITEEGLKKSSAKLFPIDTVLIAMYGATVGQVGILKSTMCTNQAICGILPNKDFHPNFLKYVLLANKKNYLKQAMGGAQPNISQQVIKSTYIPIVKFSEQESVVSELDKINELIRLKKEQLKDFDNLAQSLFYEMFGDPVENEKGWEVKKLGDCFSYIKNGANIKQTKDVDGFPITRIETLAGGIFNRDRMGYAGIYDLSKYSAYVLESGDLLMSHINSKTYIGRTVEYKRNNDETIIHGMNLLRLKAIHDIIDSTFFVYYTKSGDFKSKIARIRKDAVNQSSFAISDLKRLNIPLPPLSLQRLFAQRIEQIEREKSEVQKSIQDLETLLASRMQYWFE